MCPRQIWSDIKSYFIDNSIFPSNVANFVNFFSFFHTSVLVHHLIAMRQKHDPGPLSSNKVFGYMLCQLDYFARRAVTILCTTYRMLQPFPNMMHDAFNIMLWEGVCVLVCPTCSVVGLDVIILYLIDFNSSFVAFALFMLYKLCQCGLVDWQGISYFVFVDGYRA